MSDADTVATCQGATWTYDAWGNRKTQTPTKGSCGMWNQGYDPTNRITGWSYDAAGNLLNDGSHQYFYDAGEFGDRRDVFHSYKMRPGRQTGRFLIVFPIDGSSCPYRYR